MLDEEAYGRVQSRVMARDIRRGRYSEPELGLLTTAVRSGECVLDVGANYGLYSYHLSRAVGPSGQVLAFEPIPFTVGVLRRVIKILDLENVNVIPIGCSDRRDTVEFTVPVQPNGAPIGGLAHLARRQNDGPGMPNRLRFERSTSVHCEVAPLDVLVPPQADVSLLKIDVEGAELAVLRGGTEILTRCAPTVVCEVTPWLMKGFGYDTIALREFVEGLGYAIYYYEHPNLVRVVRETHTLPNNWIFLHRRRIDRFADLIAN